MQYESTSSIGQVQWDTKQVRAMLCRWSLQPQLWAFCPRAVSNSILETIHFYTFFLFLAFRL